MFEGLPVLAYSHLPNMHILFICDSNIAGKKTTTKKRLLMYVNTTRVLAVWVLCSSDY